MQYVKIFIHFLTFSMYTCIIYSMKKVKLIDVANKAGVSPAAVTRFVHGSGYLSDEKRSAIEKAMMELGYLAPSKPEKSVSQQSAPLVLVFHQASGKYFNTLFGMIGEELCFAIQNKGWLMISYYLTGEATSATVTSVIDQLKDSNLKGIVFNCVNQTSDLMSARHYLLSLSVPLVMIERAPDIFGINKVMLNSREMLFMGVRHLAHLGHRKIAFINPRYETQDVECSRYEGFYQGIHSMGIEDSAFFCEIDHYSADDGYNVMEKLFQEDRLPTAIIAADPVMVGISNWLYDHHIRIPDDMSVVGLDDTIAHFGTPMITSIAFPVSEIVHNTVRILEEAQQGDVLPQNVLLSMKLTDRGSTAMLKQQQ